MLFHGVLHKRNIAEAVLASSLFSLLVITKRASMMEDTHVVCHITEKDRSND